MRAFTNGMKERCDMNKRYGTHREPQAGGGGQGYTVESKSGGVGMKSMRMWGVLLLVLSLLFGTAMPLSVSALTLPVMMVQGPGHMSVPVAMSAVQYQWESFLGASYYEVRLRDITYGENGPVMVQNARVYGLSYDVPDALLDPGRTYRFAVAPFNSAGMLIARGWTLWQTSTLTEAVPVGESGETRSPGQEPVAYGPGAEPVAYGSATGAASGTSATGNADTGVNPVGAAVSAGIAGTTDVTAWFRPFLQTDARWKDAPYGDSTVGNSGCALLAVTNAVLYKTGRFLDPADLGAALGDCLVTGGTDVNGLLSRLTDARRGYRMFAGTDATGNIGVLAKAETETLAVHLRTPGGFALVGTWVRPNGAPGHILSLVDVRESTDGLQVLVLDSMPSTIRGTKKTGMRWLPVSELVNSDQVVRYRLVTAETGR